MKILTVAVFCAYFAVAFSIEFNRTMSSQLTGKSLRQPPNIPEMSRTRMLSTVFVNGGDKMTATLGVLLDRDRIAFPESYWIKDTGMTVDVLCSDRKVKALINLEDRIPEKKRLYLAKGIVEVKLAEEVSKLCWPLREKRYTECATANEMEPGNPVYATTMNLKCNALLQKPYVLREVRPKLYLKVIRRTDIRSSSPTFTPGEPLFYDKKIAGMYVPGISDKEGEFPENKRYIAFRKQSIGQSSN